MDPHPSRIYCEANALRAPAPILSYLPTLVVDANGEKAQLLADQLSDGGFPADCATGCELASAALRERHYGMLVYVGDLGEPEDRQCLATLRGRAPRTWIIVIDWGPVLDVQEHFPPRIVDAVVAAPVTMGDLLPRLFAFSLRSRGHMT